MKKKYHEKYKPSKKDNTMSDEVKPGIGYVDSVVTAIILPTLPAWHAIGATPNTLTTLGMLSSFACVLFLFKRKLVWCLLFLVLRWYFDYADGLLARKYKQTSVFGDWYDHVVDICFSLGVFGVLALTKYPLKIKIPIIGSVVVFYALFMVQMGCIERLYHEKHEELKETTISRLRYLCPPGPGVNIINAFDNGTLYIALLIIFGVYCHQNR